MLGKYEQAMNILARGNNCQWVDAVRQAQFQEIIDFENNIEDFFKENPAYKEKYANQELTTDKYADIYFEYLTEKRKSEQETERDRKIKENRKQKAEYEKQRAENRKATCGGDDKDLHELESRIEKLQEESNERNDKFYDSFYEYKDGWEDKRNQLKKDEKVSKWDLRLDSFEDVVEDIRLKAKIYEGDDFISYYKVSLKKEGKVFTDDLFNSLVPAVSTVYYNTVEDLNVEKPYKELIERRDKLSDKLREYDEETYAYLRDNFDQNDVYAQTEYELYRQGEQGQNRDDEKLKEDYIDVYVKGGKQDGEKTTIARRKENLTHVYKMREDLREKYYKQNIFSRIARWVLPNSWSNAGQIQNEIDAISKAIKDSGYTKEQADELYNTELKHGNELSEANKEIFNNVYKRVFVEDMTLYVGNSRQIQEKLAMLADGELYDGDVDLIDETTKLCNEFLENQQSTQLENEEDQKAFEKLYGEINKVRETLEYVSKSITDPTEVVEQLDSDETFKSLDNLGRDSGSLINENDLQFNTVDVNKNRENEKSGLDFNK